MRNSFRVNKRFTTGVLLGVILSIASGCDRRAVTPDPEVPEPTLDQANLTEPDIQMQRGEDE